MEKDLEKMSVSDVLTTDTFYGEIKWMVDYDKRLYDNDHVFDGRSIVKSLIEKGVYTPGEMVLLFGRVLDKKAKGFSARERAYVRKMGQLAYVQTIKKLKEKK